MSKISLPFMKIICSSSSIVNYQQTSPYVYWHLCLSFSPFSNYYVLSLPAVQAADISLVLLCIVDKCSSDKSKGVNWRRSSCSIHQRSTSEHINSTICPRTEKTSRWGSVTWRRRRRTLAHLETSCWGWDKSKVALSMFSLSCTFVGLRLEVLGNMDTRC